MTHLTDGTLRRLYDDALAVTGAARRHFDQCPTCRARFASIGEEAEAAGHLLRLPDLDVDSGEALAALRPHLTPASRARLRRLLSWPGVGIRRPLGVGIAAVALIAGIAAAPSLMVIFTPKTITPVEVNIADFQGLPDLTSYGTSVPPKVRPEAVAGAAEAQARTGLKPLAPANLPPGVPAQIQYGIVPEATGSFTFNADRAREAAARAGKPLPPMPAGMDGSTLIVKGGPAVVQAYGGIDPSLAGGGASPKPNQIPALVIGQARVPTVSGSGVTVKQLEDYLLAQPGLSPHLATQIRAIGDPSTTLPVPIPTGTPTHAVSVQGVQGIFVGDSTGIASGLVWVRDGVVHAVGGALTESQLLAIANSLH